MFAYFKFYIPISLRFKERLQFQKDSERLQKETQDTWEETQQTQ